MENIGPTLSLAWYAEQGLCNGRIGGSRIFLEGVTLGTRASIEGVWAYGRMKFERLSP